MKHVILYFIKSEEGATSVLVIFMLIALVIFGTVAISAAHVNYRFASLAVNWSEMYAGLDDQAEGFTADVDAALAEAFWLTAALSSQWGSEEERFAAMPNANDLYFSFALNKLNDLSALYEGMTVVEAFDDSGRPVLEISSNFVSEANADAHLRVVLYANQLAGVKGEPRYVVVSWQQWQTPVEILDEHTLWPGFDDGY